MTHIHMGVVRFVKIEDIVEKMEALFSSEKQKLFRLFPDAEIEHIGSTAVPGSISKGDLDINIRVAPEDFERAVKILKTFYEINQPDNWTKGSASFKDDSLNLGVQLTTLGSAEDDFVAHRDYLINHPEKVTELNALKEKFGGKNMDEYQKEKGEFFERLNSYIFRSDPHVLNSS